MHMIFIREKGSAQLIGEGIIFGDWSATVKWRHNSIEEVPEYFKHYGQLMDLIDGAGTYELHAGKEALDAEVEALRARHNEERDEMYDRQQNELIVLINTQRLRDNTSEED